MVTFVYKTSVFGLNFEEKTNGNFGWRKYVHDHKSFPSNVTVNLFLQTIKIKTRTRHITLSLSSPSFRVEHRGVRTGSGP